MIFLIHIMKKKNRPNLVARKSIIPAFKWWHFLFFWTIIPLIQLICKIIVLRNQYVEFYDGYYIMKRGVFHKYEQKNIFPKVVSCHVDRTFEGRLFSYGDVTIDSVGQKWDLTLREFSRPLRIKKYIDTHFLSTKEVKSLRQTIFPT